MKSCYNDEPVVRYNLDSAYRVESKTRQTPFVVAYEVKEGQAERQFLSFHDVEHFINLKDQYPYCHEIVRCPLNFDEEFNYGEDLIKGRLIFDFDCKEQLECLSLSERFKKQFVPSCFKEIIEYLIIAVFNKYYIGVDTSKFCFNWQITKYEHKFSMHLIVKNAYFSEYWVRQMRIFYELLLRTAEQTDDIIVNAVRIDIGKLVRNTLDFQIPRKNATFRMIECSKINGLPFEIDSYRMNVNGNIIDLLKYPEFKLTIYDCFVGIYHVEHLRAENCITMGNINYEAMQDELEESNNCGETKSEKRFRKVIESNLNLEEETFSLLDITDTDINKSVELFNKWNDGTFVIRDQVRNIINLDRLRTCECRISGRIHEKENAYLKLKEDGHLYFFCRRGCNNNGRYAIDLGVYHKMKKRPEGVIPIQMNKINMAKTATTSIMTFESSETKIEVPTKIKTGKNSAQRIQLGYVKKIVVPNSLKIK